jgi:hypothetical protein
MNSKRKSNITNYIKQNQVIIIIIMITNLMDSLVDHSKGTLIQIIIPMITNTRETQCKE